MKPGDIGKKQHDDMLDHKKHRHIKPPLSEPELISNATASHILRGFIKSKDDKIMSERRYIVLAPPDDEDVKILGPQLNKEERIIEINSKTLSTKFDAWKKVFGYSAAVAIVDKEDHHKGSEEKKKKDDTNNEVIYYELIKYSQIPISCCQLDWHTLQFNKGSALDLAKIDRALDDKEYDLVQLLYIYYFS